MPYVQRNEQGEIVGLTKESSGKSTEFLSVCHPEIIGFLSESAPECEGKFLPMNDLGMIRVIEDLVDLLIAKNVIVLTDLPVAVQQKLLRQRSRRTALFGEVSMGDEGEKGLF